MPLPTNLIPVLAVVQDDAAEDLVIMAHGQAPVRVHYGPLPTWPSPKELEDEFLERVRQVFRVANGTDDPSLWEDAEVRA